MNNHDYNIKNTCTNFAIYIHVFMFKYILLLPNDTCGVMFLLLGHTVEIIEEHFLRT